MDGGDFFLTLPGYENLHTGTIWSVGRISAVYTGMSYTGTGCIWELQAETGSPTVLSLVGTVTQLPAPPNPPTKKKQTLES